MDSDPDFGIGPRLAAEADPDGDPLPARRPHWRDGAAGRHQAAGTPLPELLGQPVIVDNKPGASGQMGAADVAKAAPDGYTFLTNASIHVINPHVYSKPLVDPIREFTPVALIGVVPLVMVVPPMQPAKDVKEFIAWAKANPGKVNFASASSASAQHLAGEHFKQVTGIDMQHVPYNGSGPALADLVGGHVQLMFDSLPSSMSFIRSGKLKALGASSPKRLAVLPDVPTLIEAGVPDFDLTTWYGVWAPAGTPKDIVARMNAEIVRLVVLPDMKEKLAGLGVEASAFTPEQFAAFNRTEYERWGRIVRAANIKLD
ncbi:MAG: tripartite tricarboxylate transporter substrate binding protein [Betaproteobacteria bacterium]|nr:tripartite tricarboxylate transporter substrate binding protein [Betaproteobacteria bacterium]